MKLKSYTVKSVSEDGRRAYCVVALADGSSFGQWVDAGPAEVVDVQIAASVERVAAAKAAPSIASSLLGVKRDAAQVEASKLQRRNAEPATE